MTDRASTDLRLTLGPALLAVLAASLFLADRGLDGTAQTVARIVLLIALLAATAWCGSALGRLSDSDADSRS